MGSTPTAPTSSWYASWLRLARSGDYGAAVLSLPDGPVAIATIGPALVAVRGLEADQSWPRGKLFERFVNGSNTLAMIADALRAPIIGGIGRAELQSWAGEPWAPIVCARCKGKPQGKCSDCSGSGKCECSCGNAHDCCACGGSGGECSACDGRGHMDERYERHAGVIDRTGIVVSRRLLARALYSLPLVATNVVLRGEGPERIVALEHGHHFALVMPMRDDPRREYPVLKLRRVA